MPFEQSKKCQLKLVQFQSISLPRICQLSAYKRGKSYFPKMTKELVLKKKHIYMLCMSCSQIPEAVLVNDATGRLLKYSSLSKQVTVLLRGLGGAGGVAISSNASFVLVTEFISKRIQKFWLSGPKAFTSQVILTLQGRPDNIKRTPVGDNFWVAVSTQNLGGLFIQQ